MPESVRRDEALRLWEQGYRLQMRHELDAAISAYRRSIAVLPTAEAHTFLGWALSWQGEVDQAIEQCKRAIEVDPDFGNPYNDIGAYLIEQGKLEESIPWLERAKTARRYEPRHFPHLNLGRAYARLGRTTQAIGELEAALRIAPTDSVARELLNKLRSLN